ncbi:MAG: DUF2341 domain-containing protein [Planctomycetes bacterium]|nr:DUF2341 domain-containing protein [Planctomycetota bacterium]
MSGVLLLLSSTPAQAQFGYRKSITIDRTQVKVSPAYDAASNVGTASDSTGLTWSHTTSGSERLLIVGVSIQNASSQTVSSVTYAGTNLTQAGAATNGTAVRSEIWYLVAPATGANDIVVTLSAAAQFAAGAASFTGVHQTSPLGTFASATGTGTAPSANVSSAGYELVIDTLAQRNSGSTSTIGAGQVGMWNRLTGDATADDNVRSCGSTEEGAASVTMSWTISASRAWAIGAVPIKPSATLQDYPLLFSVTDADLKTTGNGGRVTDADGDDIVFRARDAATCGGPDACTLDHEIERYEPATGKLVAWVRIPRLNAGGSASDTVIYIYYGNSDVTSSTERKTSVWDSEFEAVWHLRDDPDAGGSGDIKDSTSNAKDGTAEASMTSDDLVDAMAGKGIEFDGTDDCIVFPDPLDSKWTTVSAWIFETNLSNQWHTVVHRDSASGTWYDFQLYARASDAPTANRAVWRIDLDENEQVNEQAQSDIVLSTSTWYYLCGTYDGTALRFYRDGVLRHFDRETGPIPDNDDDVWIGRNSVWSEPLTGIIDEVRISSIARSPGWIQTEYANMSDPGDIGSAGFYEVGEEEGGSLTAVELLSFSATGRGASILVAWETAAEIDTLGFDVLRAEHRDGPYRRLNERLIPGLVSSPRGRSYAFLDETADRSTLHWFVLEEVEFDGDREAHGPICVDWDGGGIPDDEEHRFFVRGDVDANGRLDVADPIRWLSYEFLGTPVPPCFRAADLDGDGVPSVADAVRALAFLFAGAPPPPPPFPACGADPSPDPLSCASYPPCGS